jgi:hypothetical protein
LASLSRRLQLICKEIAELDARAAAATAERKTGGDTRWDPELI